MREREAGGMRKMMTWLRNRLHRRHLVYLVTIAASVLFLWLGNAYATEGMYIFDGLDNSEVVTAKVTQIWARDARPLQVGGQILETVTVYFEAEITGGPRKGKTVGAEQINDPFSPVAFREVERGDRVTLVHYQRTEDDLVWIWQEYLRLRPLAALGGLFVLLLLAFSGKQGFHTIVSLIFTCAAIFAVFVPLILSGHNIYASTLAVCSYVTVMTLALISGCNYKSLSAAVGCLGGMLACGVIVLVMGNMLGLTGMLDEESAFLLYINPDNPLDLKAIIFSGILIGALGATMDVAMSMASALCELHELSPELGFRALVRSGFNIGRDMISTMSNTLILAYIGGSLSISLLLIVYANSITELLNREMIVVEILQALAGSIGLLLAAPLTAVFASFILTRKQKKGFEG